MLKETQQLIIIILGIIAIASIITNTETATILATVIGILGGFLTGKKIYIDREQTEAVTVEGEEDVQ